MDSPFYCELHNLEKSRFFFSFLMFINNFLWKYVGKFYSFIYQFILFEIVKKKKKMTIIMGLGIVFDVTILS